MFYVKKKKTCPAEMIPVQQICITTDLFLNLMYTLVINILSFISYFLTGIWFWDVNLQAVNLSDGIFGQIN